MDKEKITIQLELSDEIREKLDRIIDLLEEANNDPVDFAPASPLSYPLVPKLNTTCQKCGMDFSGAMGYVCNDISCPIQMRVTY